MRGMREAATSRIKARTQRGAGFDRRSMRHSRTKPPSSVNMHIAAPTRNSRGHHDATMFAADDAVGRELAVAIGISRATERSVVNAPLFAVGSRDIAGG